ncbi:class I lanthipeptide [Acidobacteriota bacterium]
MKTKKYDKKLTLNKKILARLENAEMKVSKAGGTPWVDNPTTPVPCP